MISVYLKRKLIVIYYLYRLGTLGDCIYVISFTGLSFPKVKVWSQRWDTTSPPTYKTNLVDIM